jgi:hypothetical protein
LPLPEYLAPMKRYHTSYHSTVNDEKQLLELDCSLFETKSERIESHDYANYATQNDNDQLSSDKREASESWYARKK